MGPTDSRGMAGQAGETRAARIRRQTFAHCSGELRMTGPIPDSYWVIPERFLAGEYPSSLKDAEARAKLAALLPDAGIRSFVDLTETEDGLRPYRELATTLAAERGIDVHYRRMSIKDVGIPSAAHMVDILAHIESEMANERPIYVHCWGGIGRTGDGRRLLAARVGWPQRRRGHQANRQIAPRHSGWLPSVRRRPPNSDGLSPTGRRHSTRRTMPFQRRCDALLKFRPMFDRVFGPNGIGVCASCIRRGLVRAVRLGHLVGRGISICGRPRAAIESRRRRDYEAPHGTCPRRSVQRRAPCRHGGKRSPQGDPLADPGVARRVAGPAAEETAYPVTAG